jgi:integrase
MAKPTSRRKKAPKRLLALPDLEHAKTAVLNSLTSASGQRTYDHAIREFVAWYCSEPRLAFNRGLRRAELLALRLESIQQREEHWVIADLVGKGGHIRTVPIPAWVKRHVDAWTAAAAVTHGPVFRAINKAGRVWGDGMSPKVQVGLLLARLLRHPLTKKNRKESGIDER